MPDKDQPKATATRKPNFWKTLPGVLTAVGGLITAIGGLILALHQAGLLPRSGGAQPPPMAAGSPTTTTSSSPAGESQPTSTGLGAVADGVTYTIQSGQRKPYSASEYLLVLQMTVSTKADSMNFEDGMFRLSIDGLKSPPHANLSNQWVQGYSDWKEAVEFVVPNDAKRLSLQVGRAGSDRVAVIPLPLDVVSRW